jgi:hypothetical protein
MSKGPWTKRKLAIVVRTAQELGLAVTGLEYTEGGGFKVTTAPGPKPASNEQDEWKLPDDTHSGLSA